MAIDWSKYGVENKKTGSGIDWNRYKPLSDDQQSALMQEQSDVAQMDAASHVSDRMSRGLSLDERPGRDLPVIGPVLRGLDAFSENPVVDTGASILRSFYTPGAGVANVGGLSNAVNTGISKVLPGLSSTLLGRSAQGLAREAITGAPIGAGQALTQGGQLDDAAQGALYGAGLGGALGAAGPLAGRGLQSIGQKYAGTKMGDYLNNMFDGPIPTSIEPSVSEPLALPLGRGDQRIQSFMERSKQGETGSPMAPGDYAPNALPSPTLEAPTIARVGTKAANPYAQKLEDLFAAARQENLPPGREREALDDLWSRMAGPQDPSLDKLIELATPTLKQLESRTPTIEKLQQARDLQRQREVFGVGMPVKGLGDRYAGGVMGEAAPMIERVGIKGKGKAINVDSSPIIDQPALIKLNEKPSVTKEPSPMDAVNMKDLSGFQAYTTDVYRNFENVMGKDQAQKFLEPFNQAKKDNILMQEDLLTKLKTEVVDNLGIHKGSKLSELVQKYGEKQIDLEQLKAAVPKDWQKVVKADQWFRNAYDTIINDVNAARAKVYPNNPDKLIPKRSDYYRHFQEFEGLAGLKNLFDTPSAIDPSLAGISEFVTPKTKWASFMQRRGLGPFKNDAVGGFLNYIPAASYSTHIDPQISRFRDLGKTLAEGTQDTKHLNNFIEFLNDYSNDLAGKTNPADRFIQKIIPGGRKAMAALQWVNNRVKANTILGNVGSTLSQLANIPNGIAFAKQYSAKGAGETLASAFGKNTTPMSESGFLKERFAGGMYRQFNTKLIDKPRYVAEWMMETSDRIGTEFIWNSAYAKGVAQKEANPIAYADDAARKLVAGRGIGEVPILQKSKIVQLVAPFQLEVANLWRVQKDFIKAKDFTALAVLFAGNYLFNRGMEQVRGSGVVFDPIQAMVEASATGLSPLERGGRLAGEVLSNVPLGQTLAGIYPEFGGNVMGMDLPTRKKLFGDNDPTRFGGGLLAIKGAQDPLYKLALPFGGNQLKKTIQGADAMSKGGSYDNKGQLKFPIEPTATNMARIGLFGPTATPEGRDFYKNDRRPLSPDQTNIYENSADKPTIYKTILKQREINNIESSIMKVRKDKALSDDEKIKKINELQGKLQKSVGR